MDLISKATTTSNNSGEKKKGDINININFFKRKVPEVELILAIQNLAVMLESGLSIQDGFDVIIDQSQNAKLKSALTDVLNSIKAGETLYESLKLHPEIFTQIVVSVVNAGEQGGTLETNLKYLGDYLKKQFELRKKIKGALFYPIMVLGLSLVEAIGVIFFVLPQLETFFSSVGNVPPLTKTVLGFGKFVRTNTVLLGILLIFGSVGLFYFLKTKPGRYLKDYLALHTPIVSKLTKSVVLSNFSRTMGILLESGQPVYNALLISAETLNNRLYMKEITEIKNSVMSGISMADSFAKSKTFFPPLFTKMVAVGERAGILEKNFISLNSYYTGEAEEISNNFATLIEPIMLIFVGLVVAVLGITVVAPLYQTVASLKV